MRYFKDQVSAENINPFFFEDGVVDVEPIRDTNGSLTELNQFSDVDFIARTEKQEEIKAEFDAAGMTGNSGSFELGDPNDRDDSLDAYTACHSSPSDGINLKVIRNKNGIIIEKQVETETQELEP